MKPKPENWETLGYERQMKHLMGRDTGVCWCNPALAENCDKCRDLPDIKEEDRNYHEEAIIIAKSLSKESRKESDAYWMYKNFLELDDPNAFNHNIRYYFIEEGHEFDTGFAVYHKSIRQCDYYSHLHITTENRDENGNDFVSAGIIDSMLHTFINMSEIPYQVLRKLITLR